MLKQNNNAEEKESNHWNRANAVTQVPARTEIQNTCSRLHTIDPIIEKYATSLLIQFPALVLQSIFNSTQCFRSFFFISTAFQSVKA